MKIWYVEIEYVVRDENKIYYQHNNTLPLCANSRQEAIMAGLDVGQAISRSANAMNGKKAIYFRVLGVEEKIV